MFLWRHPACSLCLSYRSIHGSVLFKNINFCKCSKVNIVKVQTSQLADVATYRKRRVNDSSDYANSSVVIVV